MIKKRGRRKVFSLNYLFASFFGALMIASAFAYYNYKFSQFKFFNFYENLFYKKKDIFIPKENKYLILLYSSKIASSKVLIKKIKLPKDEKILAIDLYQKRFKDTNSTIYITSGINTLLKFIQAFNIYKVPVIFEIKKFNTNLYKQNSKLMTIE